MKFSFLTYQFARYPLEFCFQMAKEYGYEGVEIWGARPHAYAYDMDQEAISNILSWKKKYGVEVSMLTPEILAYPYNLCSASLKEQKETVDYLIKNVEVASAIGTEKLQIAAKHSGYGRDREEVWNIFVENTAKVCKRAEELGIDIIMETLSPSEGNLLTTADDVAKLQKEVGSKALCTMIDVVPPFIANEPFAEYFDKCKETMKYVHLCNCDGMTEFHMQLDDPRGMIPMADFLRILKRYGYDGWCSVELLAPYFRDPELYLSQSMRILDQICTETGIGRG